MKQEISTTSAPAAIGPYSQAIALNGLVFVSGQVALDPLTGQMVNDSLEAETAQVLKNLAAVLEASNSHPDLVLKTTIFLTSMDFFATVNELYGQTFGKPFPARETVAVAGLPKNARVEISCIAALKA